MSSQSDESALWPAVKEGSVRKLHAGVDQSRRLILVVCWKLFDHIGA